MPPSEPTNDPQRRLEPSPRDNDAGGSQQAGSEQGGAHSSGDRSLWHLLGAGSIGCLFAANLQLAGRPLRLILRDEAGVEQLRHNGGIVLQRGAAQHTVAIAALPAKRLAAASIRKLLVCTKAHQTVDALAAIRDALDPAALIVLLQNGMGVREQLAALLPHAVVLNALSTEGAYRSARFHVVHAGAGNTLIGACAAAQRALARATAAELQCGLPIAAVDDIERRLWHKLVVNSAINPLTALHDCSNGAVLELPGIDALLAALCGEACAVAKAEGLALDAGELIASVRRVCTATADNRSSMLQDIRAHRRTEIDFINGHLLRKAAIHGIDCPHQADLHARIKALERERHCA